jgi:hypothetical protein
MPEHRETGGWDVLVYPLYHPGKVAELLRRLDGLTDSNGQKVTPGEWWKRGEWHTGKPKRAKAVVIAFQLSGIDRELADEVGYLLERRHRMTLDWCSGWDGKKLYLVVKTLAARWNTGRLTSYFRLTRGDLAAIRDMLPRREKPRDRERERSR